jgi:hypothetical protein
MAEPADILAEVCDFLAVGKRDKARSYLNNTYPFRPAIKKYLKLSDPKIFAIFLRDGFIDRYSGKRLIFLPALRLISRLLEADFPYLLNWKMAECHIAYWQLAPTVDHVIPLARGGAAKDELNLLTTSMLRNGAKANFLIEELGWQVFPEGNFQEWDGLVGWFVRQVQADPEIRNEPYFKKWYQIVTGSGAVDALP